MAFYQILFWQDIPTQVKAWDDFDELKLELSAKFITKIDQHAKEQGLVGEDDYLSQFRWGEELEKQGNVDEVAESIKKELEEKFSSI